MGLLARVWAYICPPEPEVIDLDVWEEYHQQVEGDVFPHCDQYILHSPGACRYCDQRPEWQLHRIRLGIAFSDMPTHEVVDAGLIPCPSTQRRTPEVRDLWPGNQARP